MSAEDRPWDGPEPTGQPDGGFAPIPTGIAVFLAVAAPIVFGGIALGVRRDGDPLVGVMVLGVVIGVGAGILAFLGLARARDGRLERAGGGPVGAGGGPPGRDRDTGS